MLEHLANEKLAIAEFADFSNFSFIENAAARDFTLFLVNKELSGLFEAVFAV